jgi:hypothetical protein
VSRTSRLGALASILVFAGFLSIRPALIGQSIFGTIVGTVTDASSAAVPGAAVTVTNTGTNEKRQFLTSPAGQYEINNLFQACIRSKWRCQASRRTGKKESNSRLTKMRVWTPFSILPRKFPA